MPRVVIELHANTAEAVASIQRFAKAQKDAFDAIKVGNATLADATVKVSKLTESTAAAAKGATAATGAFRSLATQGIGSLTSEIPGATTALGALDRVLGNFPIAITATIGVGLAFLKMLQNWQQEATKTLATITSLSDGLQSKFQESVLKVQQIRAQAAGDETKAIVLGADLALREAARVRDGRIAALQTELEQTNLFGQKRQELEEKTRLAILDAEGDFRNKEREIAAQGLADLDKIGQERLEKRKKQLEDETKAAAEAAEKQAKLLETLAQKSLAIFQGLGAGFKGVTDALTLAQFVKDSTAALDTLTQAFDNGIIPLDAFTQGTQALQEKMAEAIRLGYVPTIEKAKELGDAITESAEDALSAGERWLRSIEGISSALDEVIAKTRAAGAASGGGAPRGGPSGGTTATGGGGGTLAPGGGLDPLLRTIEMIGGSFQHGGIVPGTGPVPIIAHGGERIIPAGGGGGGGARVVRIEPGAIQISGTVIQQDRDWAVLVEHLGAALAARLR